MDSHEAFLQAAGGDYRRAAQLVGGTAKLPTELETAIVQLARTSVESPASLTPADLDPLRACAGDGALDYLYVLMSFHFINRIADLLHVPPEAIPESLRFVEPLRRFGVHVAARLIGGSMDLENRVYESDFAAQVDAIRDLLPLADRGHVPELFACLRNRPKVIEALRLALEDRRAFQNDHPKIAAIVHHTIQASLPSSPQEIEGVHPRPADPVEAFAFVGTRYAQRTTRKMVDALRESGLDDSRILRLAMAVADGNQWERCWRMLGLPKDLYWGSE